MDTGEPVDSHTGQRSAGGSELDLCQSKRHQLRVAMAEQFHAADHDGPSTAIHRRGRADYPRALHQRHEWKRTVLPVAQLSLHARVIENTTRPGFGPVFRLYGGVVVTEIT